MKTGSLNAQQATANRTDTTALNKSGKSGYKQRHGDKKTGSFQIKFQRSGNNKRWGNNCYKIANKCCKAAKTASFTGGRSFKP